MNQLAAEKREVDRSRAELEQAHARADAEAEAARNALAHVEAQRGELEAMRTDLLKTRAEMEQFEQAQQQGAADLERSLGEAKAQQLRLEEELRRVRAQAVSSRTLDSRLGQLEQMQAKLRVTERELADTRQALEAERGRRDRAIALIKPKPAEVRS